MLPYHLTASAMNTGDASGGVCACVVESNQFDYILWRHDSLSSCIFFCLSSSMDVRRIYYCMHYTIVDTHGHAQTHTYMYIPDIFRRLLIWISMNRFVLGNVTTRQWVYFHCVYVLIYLRLNWSCVIWKKTIIRRWMMEMIEKFSPTPLTHQDSKGCWSNN